MEAKQCKNIFMTMHHESKTTPQLIPSFNNVAFMNPKNDH